MLRTLYTHCEHCQKKTRVIEEKLEDDSIDWRCEECGRRTMWTEECPANHIDPVTKELGNCTC